MKNLKIILVFCFLVVLAILTTLRQEAYRNAIKESTHIVVGCIDRCYPSEYGYYVHYKYKLYGDTYENYDYVDELPKKFKIEKGQCFIVRFRVDCLLCSMIELDKPVEAPPVVRRHCDNFQIN